VAPAGMTTRGGQGSTVPVSIRAGTGGWSDTSVHHFSFPPFHPPSSSGHASYPGSGGAGDVPSSSFTYISVWKPMQAVPRFFAVLPASGGAVGGGDESDGLGGGGSSGGLGSRSVSVGRGSGGSATVLVLGRGLPPHSDHAAACAGLPGAVVLAVGYGRALCRVAVSGGGAETAATGRLTPFDVSFVITAAPVVLLALPDASPAAAAAAAAAPAPIWVQGYNLHAADAAATNGEPAVAGLEATLYCCLTPSGAGAGKSWCTPARAVSSALAACEPPTDVDPGPALLSVGAGMPGGGHGVSFALLSTAAVPVAASATPSGGPAEGGTVVTVAVETVDGVSGGLQGADAPECRFGSLWPIAGRLASRASAIECISPAAARMPTPAPVAARGRISAAAWASISPAAACYSRFRGTADGTAAGGSVDAYGLTALPPSLPVDHPVLLAAPAPHPGPGWNVIDQSETSISVGRGAGGVDSVRIVIVMVEVGPRQGASYRMGIKPRL